MKIAPSIKRFGFGAAAALVLTSCLSEMPRPFATQPELPFFVPTIAPVVTSSLAPLNARMKSNRVKYSNTGKKASYATAGSVTLRTRAFLGKDGATSFEATTGVFDQTPGVDRIEKTMLRALTAPTIETVQDWPNSPSWQYSLLGLVPGDIMHLQASVKARGVSRTEVLRVTDTVVRRPDLAVVRIDGPSSVNANQSLTLFALVAEQNGDHGAQANCRLSVDGSPVDEATAIWVDAGDAVTCQFAYLFTATGTHNVTVSLTDVLPGDWDDANNAATKQIEVVAPGTPVAHGQIDAFEESFVWEHSATRGAPDSVDNYETGSQDRSTTTFYAMNLARIPGPLQRVEAKLSTASATVFESTLNQLLSYRYVSQGATFDCVDYFTNAQVAQACTRTNLDGTGDSWVYYNNVSGTVTYYGRNLYCAFGSCMGPTNYAENLVVGSGQRYGLTPGSSLRVQLTFVDATGENHIVDQSVTMVDVSSQIAEDYSSCQDYDGLALVCLRRVTSGMRLHGQAGSSTPMQP